MEASTKSTLPDPWGYLRDVSDSLLVLNQIRATVRSNGVRRRNSWLSHSLAQPLGISGAMGAERASILGVASQTQMVSTPPVSLG
jgi:hypothetical protein